MEAALAPVECSSTADAETPSPSQRKALKYTCSGPLPPSSPFSHVYKNIRLLHANNTGKAGLLTTRFHSRSAL